MNNTIKEKIRIYLIDPDHFRPGNRISIPMGIGSIASYCKSLHTDEVEFSLFKNPEELMTAIKQRPPHILGCSFYMWNKNLTLKIIEASKIISPSIITAIGGPNVARNTEYFKEILKTNPSLDIIVLDQGEKSFANIVERFLSEGANSLFSKEIDGCALRLNRQGQVVRGQIVKGGIDINKFPSPYLAGYFDHFLAADFTPTFETVRGCPHQCTFCGGGIGSFLPLSVKNEETIREELLYILKRCKSKELDLTDTNFGIMGDRDLRTSFFMLKLYEKHGFPQLVGYATTKQKTKTSIELMVNLAKMTGYLYFALQTFNEDVLNNCKRKNIPLETIEELIKISKGSNWPILVDIIFGLPGETLQSFMKTVDESVRLGVSMQIYQLRLLRGTTIAEEEREKYKYKTKFRIVNNRFGEYNLIEGAEPSRLVETEEVACGNNTFDFADYLTIRSLGLLITLLVNYGTLLDTISYLLSRNIKITEIIKQIQKNYHQYPSLVELFDKYNSYSKGELFETEEELERKVAHNDKQWGDLLSGSSRYFKLDLGFVGYCVFENTAVLEDIIDIVKKVAKDHLSPGEQEDLNEVIKRDKTRWVTQKKADGKIKTVDLTEKVEVVEEFDYEGWKAENFRGSLATRALKKSCHQVCHIENFDLLIKKIQECDHLSGFLFYERVIGWGPKNLRRICKVV
ncbi:MAG: hypothetical protein CMI54_03680 [Parcubacteria group bacterium]|nr:hypothetical protein [Parcubacteria group bacterium]